MASRTPVLSLVLQYLQDIADIRIENENWLRLDRLFHSTDGHVHDGVDSPLIDEINYVKIYERIIGLEERMTSVEKRLIRNEMFMLQFYAQFLRHNHTGVETLWTETFFDYNQTDRDNTTAILNPHLGYLHLPFNYVPNQVYRWIGTPFKLESDPWPELKERTTATGVITIGDDLGQVTPYLTVADTPTLNSEKTRYLNAVEGQFVEETVSPEKTVAQYSFLRKRVNNDRVPHEAWHHYGKERPPLTVYNPGSIHYLEDRRARPFNQAEYDRIARATGEAMEADGNVVTHYDSEEPNPRAEEVNLQNEARPLYHGDRVLAWNKERNTFYWFDPEESTYREIKQDILGPIYHNNMVEVAAGRDPSNGDIYVLASWVAEVENPPGYFALKHQIVKWNRGTGGDFALEPLGGLGAEFDEDGEPEFVEGPIWTSLQAKRYFWLPEVIAPTHLEIHNTKISIITNLNFRDSALKGTSTINYYEDAGDFQWFPFITIFGDLFRKLKYLTFVRFAPGILGTIHHVQKRGDWRPVGPAKFIGGAYPQTGNRYATLSEEDIDTFEGGNDKVYLGKDGNYLVYYQAFVPHNGEEVLSRELYKNQNWRDDNPDVSWWGLVKYDVTTGKSEFVRGNMPLKVNASGAIHNGEAYITDGIEMVKQWIVEDEVPSGNTVTRVISLMATEDNQKPADRKTLGAFWIRRDAPGAKLADKVSLRDQILNPIKVNLTTGESERVATSGTLSASAVAGGGTAAAQTSHTLAVAHTKGIARQGGKKITGRRTPRVRPRDRDDHTNKKFTRGIEDGARARQYFKFFIGDVEDGDRIIIHYNGEATGAKPFQPPDDLGNDKFIRVMGWVSPDWRGLLSRRQPARGPWEFSHWGTSDLPAGNRALWLLVESRTISDAKKGVVAKLHTEYIYVTVVRQGKARHYKWDSLPKGDYAALSIEMKTSRGRDTEPVLQTPGSARNQFAVQVDSARINVISNQ